MPDNQKRYAVTSLGLRRLKPDLQNLFPEAEVTGPNVFEFGTVDAYIGWGNRDSGIKARRLAATNSARSIILEGGFLHGFFPGRKEPQASYLIDETGVHYDSTNPSDLEKVILDESASAQLLDRSKLAMDELRSGRLSKYNTAPLLDLSDIGINARRPFVLLVDQVPNDASIAGAQANEQTFRLMLEDAAKAWPDHQIVVRPHLASQRMGHLQAATRDYPDVIIQKKPCNVWPLLEQADHVYTISSHCGFEALVCGTPVSCFGFPFYAGWGLTQDRLPASLVPNRGKPRSLEAVFAAAYLQCSRYLDMHDRTPTTLENTIDTLSVIVESRARNRSLVATASMSLWKRKAVEPFLISRNGKPLHFSTVKAAQKVVDADGDGVIAVWGERIIEGKTPDHDALGQFRLEDGFLRSTGLGAALRFPLSLVRDTSDHLYYDSRGAGMIETFLNQRPFDDELLSRASKLIDQIVEYRLTKYRLDEPDNEFVSTIVAKNGQLKILVTGQVEDDASIRLSAHGIKTNTELLQAVRKLYPDALIAYREHPDVAKNLRPGKADRTVADLDGDATSLANLLDWCDRLETLTSLTGFEALLRGKDVGVHGQPFYAGWGLTNDRLDLPARGRATLEELVAATLILYPDYIHPHSGLPCSVERAISALADVAPAPFFYRAIVHPAGLMAGKLKHRIIGFR